jgi:Ser/Thr protein kinase RdoA (MazF antagonist)
MNEVARGPASRAEVSPALHDTLRDHYGLQVGDDARDIGGSSNLNLLVTHNGQRYVARLYRPWVTTRRLADIQLVRQYLAEGGVPCVQPIPTRNGALWIEFEGRPLEVEPYVEYDAKMDSWERLEQGLPTLGRIHSLLQYRIVSEDGRYAPAANYINPRDTLPLTLQGTSHIRTWDATPAEIEIADAADDLARLVDQAQHGIENLPHHLVHGDYWDNNVLFRDGHIVHVADLDFMGERARIDDLALTLYYTNSTFAEGRDSDERIRQLRLLVDAYDSGMNEPLTRAERTALPIALARTSLAFIAMIPHIDSETGARRMAAEMQADIGWPRAILHNLGQWQSSFLKNGTNV